ncbi:hypothetical protein N7540_012522 [Penicillium herquei]|nr:hypothetical protein N7540_012522 [Penicillium herquei]
MPRSEMESNSPTGQVSAVFTPMNAGRNPNKVDKRPLTKEGTAQPLRKRKRSIEYMHRHDAGYKLNPLRVSQRIKDMRAKKGV